jgi:hypothetical protein
MTRFWVVCCLVSLLAAVRASELTLAVTPDDLDLPQCQAFSGGRSVGTAPGGVLLWKLALAPKPAGPEAWSTGPSTSPARHFRLAFTRPLSLGTIVSTYTGGVTADTLFGRPSGLRVSLLKPDAPYPGDVTNDAQWIVLGPGAAKTLPVGATVRALRVSDYRNLNKGDAPETQFGTVVLLKERYYSPLIQGHEKEQEVKNSSNSWLGYWSFAEPPALAGVVFTRCRATSAQLQIIKAGVTTHPLLAKAEHWRLLPAVKGDGGPALLRIDPSLNTTGLRVQPKDGGRDFSYTMGMAVPLVNLGTDADPPVTHAPTAPVRLDYAMPLDGFVAINIVKKATGAHVRHLVAEVPHVAGKVSEAWDLKDDKGQYVPPGDYEWRAIARPPLKLTYEITVNNAGQPPWFAPAPGKGGGGWLADHSPPNSVCAVGDTLFIGAPCAESGDAMIATDLDGNKLWGATNMFGGFLGARHFVGDDRYAYMINGSGVLRIDTKDNLKRQPVNLDITYTREVPGPGSGWGEYLTGAAARGDTLCLAYRAPAISWLQSTFSPGDVNLKACLPPVRRLRPEKSYREADYDEIDQFHSVFMDGGAPSTRRNAWGDAPKSGPLAGTLTVAFTKPLPVGCVLIPNPSVKVYALKPGTALSAIADPDDGDPDGGDLKDRDPLDPDLWVPLTGPEKGQDPTLAVTDAGLVTTALRFKTPRLPYALVMSHRFADVAPEAARACSDGTLTKRGGWTVSRDSTVRPISAYDPASYLLTWKAPVSVRGVTMTGMVEAKMAVDYWIGPATGDPQAALTDNSQWKEAAIIDTEVFGHFPQAPSARSADFGANVTTRAIRIRAIAPKGDTSYMGHRGVPVNGPHEAGFESVVVYSALGHDAPLPAELNERISVFTLPADPAKAPAKLARHLPLPAPGRLAFAPDGTLYAQTGDRVVTVPLDGSPGREVLPAGTLVHPEGMACDVAGKLYIADAGPRTIAIFDPATGKRLRTIGPPGGPKVGPWDPTRFSNPVSVSVDRLNRVWVAEYDFQPKRVTRWSADGALETSLLGPSRYGGGGWLDPRDHSLLYYCGMKFKIDWMARTSKLDSVVFRKEYGTDDDGLDEGFPDRVLYVGDRRYLVSDPSRRGLAIIAVERNGVAVPLVVAGKLSLWHEIDVRPELRKAFGTLNRGDYGFLWQDLNGDGIPQVAEVQTTNASNLSGTYWATRIGDNLSLHFAGVRLRTASVTADGAPRYDLKNIELLPEMGSGWETADGRCFVVADKMLAPDGKTVLWEYADDYPSVHGSHRIGYDRPFGTLVGEHYVNGHFTLKGEELFVTNGNHGDWFVFTRDGLLAGCIFGGPLQYGKRSWTMPEWKPGVTDLSDLNVGEEHFGGSVTLAEDGNVYAVAGHNHNSVVRVDGLEKMQRMSGALTVTKADLDKTVLWEQQRVALERLRTEPKIAKVPSVDAPLHVNGSLEDWPDSLFMTIHERLDVEKNKWVPDMQAALAYDGDNLYLAARIPARDGAMRNSAEKLEYLYKNGDALDVQLGLDPAADPARPGPAPGDIRLLLTRVKGKPVVMLYRFVVGDVPPAQRARIVSPITETLVDQIKEIKGATVFLQPSPDADPQTAGRGWTIEAAIPWSEIGLPAPPVGSKLRGDVGVLLGDENGLRTVTRYYWAGKNQTVVSDLAFEARITPPVWGELLFDLPDSDMRFGPNDSLE